MDRPELFDTLAAAAYIDTAPHTLEIWRSSGRYQIPFIKIGRKVRYRRADLDAFLVARTVNRHRLIID